MAGHHVVWLPLPDESLEMQTILRIRKQLLTVPASRIAKMLTDEGVPAPDSGRKRRDRGIEHVVSGVWHQTTIVSIGRNNLLAAVCTYGQRSMGDQLRFTPNGPGQLIENDFRTDNKPKVVRNPQEVFVNAPASFEPIVSAEEHEKLQSILDARSTSQRGKPRSRDPNRNPLVSRVFDMECGWPMYRTSYSGSFRYTCGLYGQSHGAKCGHHHIEGPTAAKLVVSCLVQKVLTPSALLKLRHRLAELAQNESKPVERSSCIAQTELEKLKKDQAKIESNMALAENPDQFKVIANAFEKNKKRMDELQQQLVREKRPSERPGVKAEVDAAIDALVRLPELLSKSDDYSQLTEAFGLVNARLFLGFKETQPKKRIVNKISRGVITFGETTPPILLYQCPTNRRCIGHCTEYGGHSGF